MHRRRTGESQLTLFDDPSLTPSDELGRRLERVHAEAALVAARLPEQVRFGTSSWSFPGWAGIVYSTRLTTAELARAGLGEYARHPLLRTVGIDRGFYAPIPGEDLEGYRRALPPGFLVCAKAPEAVTSPVRVAIGRSSPPQPNPDYLDPDRFQREMLDPFRHTLQALTGPFLLQFPPARPPLGPSPPAFAQRLGAFLERLPRDFRYAVELRDPALLTDSYRDVLRTLGVAHVYNYASAMPGVVAQERAIPLEDAPFTVVRLLLRPGTRYADRKQELEPFDRLVDVDEEMRRDVAEVIARASRAGRGVFVLVNNKAEGSAPLTISALAGRVAALLASADHPPERPPGQPPDGAP